MNAIPRWLVVGIVVTGFASYATPDAQAVETCKAKVDRKTGVISVDAKGVAGTLQWSQTSGGTLSPFFNAAGCLSGEKASKCQLADPATIAAKTPPAECTLYVHDGSSECAAWIPGCSPGLRGSDGLGDYVNSNCFVYFGWIDNCSGCTSLPTKWGRVNDAGCSTIGLNGTCTQMSLGGDTVRLLGLNTGGDVDDSDKFYIGLRCF